MGFKTNRSRRGPSKQTEILGAATCLLSKKNCKFHPLFGLISLNASMGQWGSAEQ